MFRSILVPLDGSSFGEHALPLALSIACHSGAPLRIMLVHQFLSTYYTGLPVSESVEERLLQNEKALRQEERTYLENVASRVREASPVKVSIVFEEGYVAARIKVHAVESKVDLVIMTTHARGTLGRFWLGSTADELVRELPMPVLLVHPKEQPADFKQPMTFKNVLVPLDGTPEAEQMLEPATSMAKLFGADITLLRMVRPLLATSIPVGMGTFSNVAIRMAEDLDKLQKQLEQEALEYLEKVAQKLRANNLIVNTRIALADQPGVGVLAEAQQLGSDLIALETHGRRGLTRLFLGSVADKVLRGSTVPVLVHRPKH
jgi:nucleotide-binding universal stress UspA family protein